MFKRKGFLFNANLCIGCRACEMACRNENHTPANIHWRHVKEIDVGTYLSMACNHCDSPECFRVCPQHAFNKRKDGIVEIDSSLCNGCRLCVKACPYDAPQYNINTNKVTRCQMCYPRQDHGLPPACVEACTTGALTTLDLNDPQLPETVRVIPGFTDIRLTKPSVLFYPPRPKRRYFLKQSDNT